MATIPINYTLTENHNIISIKVEVTQLILFQSAQFRVTMIDEFSNIVKSQVLNMGLGDYQQWSSNDEYIIQWVKSQLEIA